MVSRLFQIIYILMEKESITAKELAERLEVSVRTINRDIEKLSEARIPVYATRGRRGGISLLSDFVLNKKVLTEEEKSSILSSMRALGAVAYEDEQQMLNRLEEFFGESAQNWIEVELDSWGQGAFDQERFRLLKNAVLMHKKITFEYMGKKEVCNRKVQPHKLVFRSQSWYVYGFCELRQAFRYFKFRRMEELVITEERFEPKKLSKEEVHYVEMENTFEATFAIDKCMAYRACDELPMKQAKEEKNRFVFTIPKAHESWFYDYILSYGPYAEVLGPIEVRKEMKKRAEAISHRYQEENITYL